MLGPDDVIDHEGRLAPYRQLAEILKARITRGDWKPGRPMASETQLMQTYGLARSTVRKSVALLAEEGVVEVEPRRGTYVAE